MCKQRSELTHALTDRRMNRQMPPTIPCAMCAWGERGTKVPRYLLWKLYNYNWLVGLYTWTAGVSWQTCVPHMLHCFCCTSSGWRTPSRALPYWQLVAELYAIPISCLPPCRMDPRVLRLNILLSHQLFSARWFVDVQQVSSNLLVVLVQQQCTSRCNAHQATSAFSAYCSTV